MRRIYLDYSATTPLLPEAKDAMDAVASEFFGNPSSVHWYGRKAKALLEETRNEIAQLVDSQPEEIIFTSGGTEANVLALVGTYLQQGQEGANTHIIISTIEHHSILHTAEFLERRGVKVTIVPVSNEGIINKEALVGALRPTTRLVSLMLVNNEIGTIQPLHEIVEQVHHGGALLHTDAVQAIGKFKVSFKELGVDFLSFSAHKFYGPKGIGALLVRKGVVFAPLFYGGAQENNRRAGTENLPAIVGCARALSHATKEVEQEWKRFAEIKSIFICELQKRFDHLYINGASSHTIPHILSISFNSRYYSLDSDALLAGLDLRGIAVSSGSACSSGSITPSHVMHALGHDEATARTTLRFSVGKETTKDDIDYTLDTLEEVVALSSRH